MFNKGKWRHEEDHKYTVNDFGRKHQLPEALEQNGANGVACATVRTSWDDPLVDSSNFAKIEGNRLDFAYDSHMQNLGNFAAELEEEEEEGLLENHQETSEIAHNDSRKKWRSRSAGNCKYMTKDF